MFQAGYHEITYIAQDGAGNQAKCQFTIHVTSPTIHRDTTSPITKVRTGYEFQMNPMHHHCNLMVATCRPQLPRGRVLVRCPGSKPGKYVEMYTVRIKLIYMRYLSDKQQARVRARHIDGGEQVDQSPNCYSFLLLLGFLDFPCIYVCIMMFVCLQYKVPAGCIVINNPSAYTRATITTLAPRYTGI